MGNCWVIFTVGEVVSKWPFGRLWGFGQKQVLYGKSKSKKDGNSWEVSEFWALTKQSELTIDIQKDDFWSEASWSALECCPPLPEWAWKATILREQLTLYRLAQDVEQNLFGPLWWWASVKRPHCSQLTRLESSKKTSLRPSSLLDRLSAKDKWPNIY